MDITIPNGFYLEKSVGANKKIVFSPTEMLENVLIFGNIQQAATEGFFVFLKANFNQDGYWQDMKAASTVFFTCLLKWNTLTKTSENQFSVIVGEGTGTGKDFDGNMGAQIQIRLTSGGTSNSPVASSGGFSFHPINLFSNNPGNGFYIDTQKIIDTPDAATFKDAMGKNDTMVIEISKDAQGRSMIEQSLGLLVYDSSYQLIGQLSTDHQSAVSIHYKPNESVYILPLVQPTSDGTFEIGDPEVDAKVKVTVEDV